MKKNILVVEDEEIYQTSIRITLEAGGFKVLSAGSFEEAKMILEKERVDLLWLDHYLASDKGGLEIVALVKGMLKYANLPIFLVSNSVSPSTIEKYLFSGVTKYISKAETNLDDILNQIKQQLGA